MNHIKVKGVWKSFGNHQALRDISFKIPKNSVFGLLGPNGAGKTTLIRIITQIILADQGEILYQGLPMTPEHVRKIGYLPEERGLYKKMKVAEQLLYLARLKGMERSDAVKEINWWLNKFEIRSWINKKVEDLSKGMQQKVQFIATVIHRPELLILDEPFSGFDPVNANIIKDELLRLQNDGATIIFSTHRMESVEELCDHITLINDAQIILNGDKKTIKNEYRDNTFIVEHEGALVLSSDKGFESLGSSKDNEDHYSTEVRLKGDTSINDLVIEVTNKSRLISINEKIPSMNEIFISSVSKPKHA